MLLVHGWGASMYMWRDWFAPLAAAGRRVVAVDLPGHGVSDKPTDPGRYTLTSLVEAVRAVIAERALGTPDIVAQSMGGTIALAAAVRREAPVGRLVLVNPACFGKVSALRLARLVTPLAAKAVVDRLVPRWVVARGHRRVYGDPSLVTEADIDQTWAPSQFPGYARAMLRLVHEFSWERPTVRVMASRLRALAPPTSPPLVVLGTRDRIVLGAHAYATALRAAGAHSLVLG
ncbi:MAG: alpha/beta fold hydrolase [Gemmatimonadetes bacterium]|nr:alpha/beta fold hydrolase [Gemmatimonadota bacterium]